MRTVRAAVIERSGVPSAVETLSLADPGPGEVLVRMTASGVCHSDLHVRDGDWERPGPIVMGHEGAGVIEAVGPGLDPAAVGRQVALSWYAPCLRCRAHPCRIAADYDESFCGHGVSSPYSSFPGS